MNADQDSALERIRDTRAVRQPSRPQSTQGFSALGRPDTYPLAAAET